MSTNNRTVLGVTSFLVASLVILTGFLPTKASVVEATGPTGPVKNVIVKFKNTPTANASSSDDRSDQVAAIRRSSMRLEAPSGGYIEKTRDFKNLPYAVYRVDAEGEAALRRNSLISRVVDDRIMDAQADLPIPTIGGHPVTGQFSDGLTNFDGNGYAVAVIDSGVDKNHPLLSGKVIAEACFGTNADFSEATIESFCPGLAESSTAVDSGMDCPASLEGCSHGTSVAGAAVMATGAADIDGDASPDNLSGTANAADIVAIQANVKIIEKAGSDVCGDGLATVSECARPLESLFLAGLDYAASLSASKPIAAANLSIGSGDFAANSTECDASGIAPFNSAASALRANKIAPIVAAGNSGDDPLYYNKIATPACADSAIAVAATNILGTAIASYSNNGALVDLLAPGGDYLSEPDELMWLPQNGTSGIVGGQGTSYAAPMVAGAFAVLREKHPNASVDSLYSLLESTGLDVTDSRLGYTSNTKKLIQLGTALADSPYPTITSFSGPGSTVNEGSDIQLEATVADVTSCSLDNGIGAVTVSGNTISVMVPAAASYTLTCLNAYDDSVSEVVTFTLNAAPTTPGSVSGTGDSTNHSFTMNWSPSTDPDGVEGYNVYLDGVLMATLDGNATSYTFTNLQNQAYTASVRAFDTLGAVSAAAGVGFTITSDGVVVGVPNTGAAPSATSNRIVLQVIVALLSAIMGVGLLIKHSRSGKVIRLRK